MNNLSMQVIRFHSRNSHPPDVESASNVAHYSYVDGNTVETLCGLNRSIAEIVRHDHNTRMCASCEESEARMYTRMIGGTDD